MLRRLLSSSVLATLFLLVMTTAVGCAIIDPPRGPRIPTPFPTAPAVVSLEDLRDNPPVFDPSSAVTLRLDPDIVTLINNVSTQNLLGYVQALESFGTRHTLSETQRPDYGIGAARNWLFNEFAQVGNGRLFVSFDDFLLPYGGQTTNQQNIVATLPGASPHAGIFVMVAHYDSRTINVDDAVSLAPGATDNASGVAAMLEVARLMSSRTWNQTVVFIAFAAEEQGTHGSRHYVQNALLDGVVIEAALNNDIVGGRPGIPQSVRVFAPEPADSPSRVLARYLQLISGLYLPDFGVNLQGTLDREGRWSDHRSFVNAGIAAVRLTESEENFAIQHTRQDTWDRLDYDYLARVTQLNLATLANMAGAPPPPTAPTVTPMADPGTYLLNWTVNPLAAAYAISFRPVGQFSYEPAAFRYVSGAQAGNVALTGLDATQAYAVSLAALDINGRISPFSPEIIIAPP